MDITQLVVPVNRGEPRVAAPLSAEIPTARKRIYIVDRGGFGNKVFDIICGLFLHDLYGGRCEINCVLYRSQHEKSTDPSIEEIFPQVRAKIRFVHDDVDYDILAPRETPSRWEGVKSLADIPAYESLGSVTRASGMFNLAYQMFSQLGSAGRGMFEIRATALTKRSLVTKITARSDYSVVHIRYGDKLWMVAKTPQSHFLVYTPQYYADMISSIRRSERSPAHRVYIVTDSALVVREFILDRFYSGDPAVQILDLRWLDAFYVLSRARNIVMSCSTFCFAAAYLGGGRARSLLLLDEKSTEGPPLWKREPLPEEAATDPAWEVITDERYLLNNDVPLAKAMHAFHRARRSRDPAAAAP